MFFNDVAYAMGSAAGQEGGSGSGFGSPLSMNILLMVIIFGIFYFLIIRPQHQEARRLKDMLSALKKGDRVLTAGGIYGTIAEIREDIVVLDVGNGTIEIGRKFISSVVISKSSSGRVADRKKRTTTGRPSRSDAKEAAPSEESNDEHVDTSDEAENNESDESGNNAPKKED